LPADPVSELLALGRKHFAELEDYGPRRGRSGGRALNASRAGLRTGRSSAAPSHRKNRRRDHGQHRNPARTKAASGCAARADRIERRAGHYTILDYKTGSARTEPQVRTGLAPQLTLEAAILRRGRICGHPRSSVAELVYVLVKGGEPPGDSKSHLVQGRQRR
jgi:ATP-dependent helicase/nuclease subunit B